MFLFQKRLKLSWIGDECKPLGSGAARGPESPRPAVGRAWATWPPSAGHGLAEIVRRVIKRISNPIWGLYFISVGGTLKPRSSMSWPPMMWQAKSARLYRVGRGEGYDTNGRGNPRGGGFDGRDDNFRADRGDRGGFNDGEDRGDPRGGRAGRGGFERDAEPRGGRGYDSPGSGDGVSRGGSGDGRGLQISLATSQDADAINSRNESWTNNGQILDK